MSKKQFFVLLITCALSSLIGGGVVELLMANQKAAWASGEKSLILDELTVKNIFIKDENMKIRGSFGINQGSESVFLSLFGNSENGQPSKEMVAITVGDNLANLSFSGESAITMFNNIDLSNQTARGGLFLGVSKDTNGVVQPAIRFIDEYDKERMSLVLMKPNNSQNRDPVIKLTNSTENAYIFLNVANNVKEPALKNMNALIAIQNPNGKIWMAPGK